MGTDSSGEVKASQSHKDSCAYSIEIAKQFLTLASAGVAFVVGMAIKAECAVTASWFWSSGLLIASVAFGLLYIMSVVAHINQSDNYDVYTPMLKVLSALQILTFIVSLIIVGIIILNTFTSSSAKVKANSQSSLEVTGSEKTIKLSVSEKTKASIKITGDDAEIFIEPKK
jgi:heme/copper-type cytochrome/quinol oxidase subunit 2